MNRHFASFLEKARQGYAGNTSPQISDREFSQALGLNPAAINQWRKRGTYPTDETMMKLADFAQIDRWKALMLLNYLRATNDDVKQTYFELYRKIKAAVLILVTTGIFATASPALASGKNSQNMYLPEANMPQLWEYNVYYGNSRIQLLRYIKKIMHKLYQWLT